MIDDFPFLRTIAENPDDDGPRLVFADWLDERGDPYGEFIRLQCSLADAGDDSPQTRSMQQRALELFKSHWREWLAPVCDALDDYSPLEAASTSASSWLHLALSPQANQWLHELSQFRWGYLRGRGTSVVHSVRTWEGEEVRLKEAVFSRGFADRLTIAIWGPLNADNLIRLRQCSPLRHLKIAWNDPRQWKQFDSDHLSTISSLSLEFSRHDSARYLVRQAEMMRAVCNSPNVRGVRALYLEDVHEAYESLEVLRGSRFLQQLDQLQFRVDDDFAVETLMDRRILERLRRLEVNEQTMTLSRPGVPSERAEPGLEELAISHQYYDPAVRLRFLQILLNHSACASLRRLQLQMSDLEPALAAVAQASHMTRLVDLRLSGWMHSRSTAHIDRALTLLFDSPNLRELKRLELLTGLEQSEPTFHALRTARGVPSLETLCIRWPRNGDRIISALVGGALAARLKSIDLRECDITKVGATMLARSPRLEHIESLRLGGNDLSDQMKGRLQQRFGERVSF